VVGEYLNQFSDDKANGANVGNRMRTFGIGPSLVYDARSWNINLNYQQGVYAANTSKSNNVWLNIAIPLWPGFGRKGYAYARIASNTSFQRRQSVCFATFLPTTSGTCPSISPSKWARAWAKSKTCARR
jgi:hypothetical protein